MLTLFFAWVFQKENLYGPTSRFYTSIIPISCVSIEKGSLWFKASTKSLFDRFSFSSFILASFIVLLIRIFFISRCFRGLILLLVHVNDIVVVSNNNSSLSTCFVIFDLGPLYYFLAIEVIPFSKDFVFQSKYAYDVLENASVIVSRAISSSLALKHHRSAYSASSPVDPTKYHSIVGSL